jgi:hypothetical protein
MAYKKTLADNHLSQYSRGDVGNIEIKNNDMSRVRVIGSQGWIDEVALIFKHSNRRPSFDNNGASGSKVDKYQRLYGDRLLKTSKEKYGYSEVSGWS